MKKKAEDTSIATAAALAILRDWAIRNKVVEATVSFSGSGDEGSLDNPHLKFEDGSDTYCDKLLAELPEALSLEELARTAIENTGVDWYNNEGGNGTCTINPRTGEVSVEMNQATTVYDTTNHESSLEDLLPK